MASPDEPVLGRPDAVPSTRLDTFPAEGPLELVHFRSSELTALCPVTDQPDFYTIDIQYVPDARCIESKSLQLYLRTFAGRGIFAEHLGPEVASHLAEAVDVPVTVTLAQQVRGGIVTMVTATGSPA